MGRALPVAEGRARPQALTGVADCVPDPLARHDATARALVELAAPATFRLATNDADVVAAQGLRGQAVLEQGWATADTLNEGLEQDADDDRATHLLAFRGRTLIGTCRLIYSEEGRLLPMEHTAGIRLPQAAVEVGRVVIIDSTGRDQRAITAGLIARAWLELRARGQCRICGTVSAPMLRLLRRMGFLVRIVGPQVTTFGEDRCPVLFEPEPATATLIARYGDVDV